jgi:hypothetical protein
MQSKNEQKKYKYLINGDMQMVNIHKKNAEYHAAKESIKWTTTLENKHLSYDPHNCTPKYFNKRIKVYAHPAAL